MLGFNRCLFVGKVTRPVSLHYSRESHAFAFTRLYVEEPYRAGPEQKTVKIDMVVMPIMAFDGQAEFMAAHVRKDDWLLVEGRLRIRWTRPEPGKVRHPCRVVVVAERWELLAEPRERLDMVQAWHPFPHTGKHWTPANLPSKIRSQAPTSGQGLPPGSEGTPRSRSSPSESTPSP